MKLIVTVGMPGSGKDEIVSIAKGLGIHVLKMGDLVRNETRRRGLSLNDQNIGRVAGEEREKHGPAVWAKRLVPLVTETKTLIDGCRGEDEVALFRHNFGDLVLVGVHASPETRYERLRQRRRNDDSMSMEAFYERDRRELKWGIGNALALADWMLVNEGTLSDFRSSAEKCLKGALE